MIGAIGVGINESDTSLRFVKAGDFDCMLLAGRYTLLEQGGLDEFLPECLKRNVSVILGGPYNSGILTGGVKPGATHDYAAAPAPLIEKAQKIEAVCQRHGVELGAAAMQFPLFHPALCAVIPGALSVTEVKQNVGRLSAKIPVELWSELKREKLLDPESADAELERIAKRRNPRRRTHDKDLILRSTPKACVSKDGLQHVPMAHPSRRRCAPPPG